MVQVNLGSSQTFSLFLLKCFFLNISNLTNLVKSEKVTFGIRHKIFKIASIVSKDLQPSITQNVSIKGLSAKEM